MSAARQQTAAEPSPASCLNCGAPLAGDYCSRCGQHVQHHVHSTWATVGEFIEDLFHADHRVWRTLVPLLFKPGRLTAEYLRGKRVSYTPPFRLYIVLSLIFFVTAPLNESSDASATDPDKVVATDAPALDAEARKELDTMLERVPEEDRQAVERSLAKILGEAPPDQQRRIAAGMNNPCTPENISVSLPGLREGALKERLMELCKAINKDNGQDFAQALGQRIPQMMFLFLPLIALFGKLLYVGSRRYYAEHLLFFVHYHAFIFLALTGGTLLGWGFGWFAGEWASVVPGLYSAVLVFYIPIYLYKAMRHVYAQGRIVTTAKFFLLSISYLISCLITFLTLLILTALTLK